MKTTPAQNQAPERFARPAHAASAPASAPASDEDAARARPKRAAVGDVRASDLRDAAHGEVPASAAKAAPAHARGLPAEPVASALRARTLQKLRRGLAERQRLSAADHAWALFATLPTELPRAVTLHAAAYLQRLTAPASDDALPGDVVAARDDAQALYQGPLDFMACVVIASKIAGTGAQVPKPREWLMTFRAALELHRSALGYQAQLPAVDAKFIFAAEASVGARLDWSFKVSPEAQDRAAGALRAQTAATAELTRLWDFADVNQPHEETFRKLLWQCLVG